MSNYCTTLRVSADTIHVAQHKIAVFSVLRGHVGAAENNMQRRPDIVRHIEDLHQPGQPSVIFISAKKVADGHSEAVRPRAAPASGHSAAEVTGYKTLSSIASLFSPPDRTLSLAGAEYNRLLVYTRSIQLFTVRISSIYPSSSLGVSRINGSP